ncbi:hypothetical protein C5167_007469 [Papaver somniferum]|nr:hypothetical protein C5167_007469 [Papaver somniferum]
MLSTWIRKCSNNISMCTKVVFGKPPYTGNITNDTKQVKLGFGKSTGYYYRFTCEIMKNDFKYVELKVNGNILCSFFSRCTHFLYTFLSIY